MGDETMACDQLTIFYDYIKKGDVSLIHKGIIEGIFDVTENDNWPIIYASMYASLDTVKSLLSLSVVNPNAQNNRAIKSAAFHGRLDIVKYLLTMPDHLNITNTYTVLSALLHAVWGNHLETIKFLSTLPNVDLSAYDNEAIISAAKDGNLDMVKFISTCNNVNVAARGNAAIFWAACAGKLEIVEFLLTLPNVDITACENAAIRWALEHNHYAIVAMLLYWEPIVKVTLDMNTTCNWVGISYFHRKILDNLVPIAHKISVCFVELPTPIIIEIIDQSIDFAIYVPYHIKWNMVVKIKH